jgi:hypothetical protein
MLSLLRLGVILSFLISIISLSILVLKTFSFGKKPLYAKPQGKSIKGIFYAFGRGMMPWEKESVRKHLPTYMAGIMYHTSIFTALFYLISIVCSFGLPGHIISLFRILFVLGSISGFSLLLRRIFLPHMKKISCPDDFASNIIVGLFLISALVNTYFVQSTRLFFVIAIFLFLYIPVGKIRHCFFFVYVRILFGLFYGRRGVLPPKTRKA